MKSGRLVHVIEIQRGSATVNDAGTPAMTWAKLATLRAELVERSAEEFLRNAGETSETVIVFRTRYLSDVTNADRVSFETAVYDIEELVIIGRRKGLEIRCKEIAP